MVMDYIFLKVKLAVYHNRAEQHIVEFSGTGTDKMNWMSKNRITFSTYTDMTSSQSYNFFGISGYVFKPNS